MNWIQMGTTLHAQGKTGEWSIHDTTSPSFQYWLTFQPNNTRGMLNRGKFSVLADAKDFAQRQEDGKVYDALKAQGD